MFKKSIDFLCKRLESFHLAFCGFRDVFLTEYNAWVHAVMTIVAVSLMLWLQLSLVKCAIVVIVITLVWVAEAFNTVLEVIVSMVASDYTDVAKRAKDIAAGAVLCAAAGAVIVGVLMIGPPLLERLSS